MPLPLNSNQAVAVVVDAYGPGRWYPSYFARHGVTCVHVQSTPEPLPRLTPVDLPAFYDNIVHRGDIEDTMARIRALGGRLICVIPGVEPGVLLADRLSESLGVVSNGTAKSEPRRDKYQMAVALHTAGVAVPAFFKSGDLDAILAHVRANPGWPRVIKPLDSAGCNGVFVCKDEAEIRKAYAENIGQTNNMGRVNREMLVQSFLAGQEYMVNTVSSAGRHIVSDIWHAKKVFLEGRGFIYDRNELLDGADPVALELSAYVQTVLDALGVKHGPAHAEVIMTSDGPVLVEVGVRMSGLVDPVYNDLVLHANQISLTVEAYVHPEQFSARRDAPYTLKMQAMQVCLISQVSGTVKAIPFATRLDDLASLVGVGLKLKPGAPISTTIDLSSCPGVCNLAHADQAVMEADCAAIRARFATGVELA